MIPFSVLDLSPIVEGSSASDAFRNTLDPRAPGGALGLQPLLVGTLATLCPGRIDLGIGRAPGTDMATARALRRTLDSGEGFPEDVLEMIGYLDDEQPGQTVRAVPGAGTHVPVWILGSSLYGAQFAAHLGLPYAFASHFAPAALDQAVAIYRQTFRPSEHLPKPYFMMAINVFAADGDEEGRYLMSSAQQSAANLRSGRPGPLPRPVEDIEANIGPEMMEVVDQVLACSAHGSPDSVRAALARFLAHYEPDEVILNGQIHDHGARLRSFETAAQVMKSLRSAEVTVE